MKFKAYSSLIAASTILVSVLPVNAQDYLDILSSRENNFRCSDIVATDDFSSQGSFAQHNNGSINRSNASSSQRASNRSNNTKVGASWMGIGGSVGHGSNSSSKSSNSTQSNYGRNWETGSQGAFQQNHIVSSVKGQNCDAADTAEGNIQQSLIEASVNSKLIDSKERVRTREIESQSQTNLFNTLMQGW